MFSSSCGGFIRGRQATRMAASALTGMLTAVGVGHVLAAEPATEAPAAQTTEFEVLAHFQADGCRGASSPLVIDDKGRLYGSTSYGGLAMFAGCIYRVTPGGGMSAVYMFDPDKAGEGTIPYSDLRLEDGTTLLGTTSSGGQYRGGTVYRMKIKGDGKWTPQYITHFWRDPLGPIGPAGAPALAADGRLYGTSSMASQPGGIVYSTAADGTDLRVVHAFGKPGEPTQPASPLMVGADGAVYGTLVGGPDGRSAGGVFKLAPSKGKTSVLHVMQPGEGVNPMSGLLQAADGALYGTNTSFGGDDNWGSRGTIFKLSSGPLGVPQESQAPMSFEVLYTGGQTPSAPNTFPGRLLPMSDGSFWGVSTFGGVFLYYGTVFRFDPASNTVQTLHSFQGTDGANPHWGLTAGPDGWVYGTAQQGGDAGQGVVFRLRVTGTTAAARGQR